MNNGFGMATKPSPHRNTAASPLPRKMRSRPTPAHLVGPRVLRLPTLAPMRNRAAGPTDDFRQKRLFAFCERLGGAHLPIVVDMNEPVSGYGNTTTSSLATLEPRLGVL